VHVQAVRNAADAAPGRVLTVSARDSVSGKEIDRGVLIFQSNAFDTTSGTLDFRARFTNARQSLSPGQFVTVRVLLSKGDGVLAVPETALQQGQEGPYVYCLVDGHAKVRQLSVARLVDGQAVVSKGLKAGDEVILTVPNDLRDGSPVQSARDAARKSAAKAPAQ
jgi:RND family efflux transporter MFP subunit